MKIHTKIVIDIETYKILYDDFYEYEGPIIECEAAVIIAGIGALAAAAGAGTALYSAKSQASWNEYNAAVARQQGIATENAAEQLANQKQQQGAALMAKQRVLYASAGVDSTGTPSDVILGSAEQVNEDVQTILLKGKQAMAGADNSAMLSEMQAASASTAGYANAGSTLLTGLSTSASNYMKYSVPTYNSTGGGNTSSSSPSSNYYAPDGGAKT